jgi:zinc and cadmium transporter
MILIVAGLLFLTTFIFALAPIVWEKKALNINPLLSFCSGVLIATAFLYMLPTAFRMSGSDAGSFVLLGFLILYITERFIMVHPCQEHGCVSHTVGISAFIGLSLHCLLTGFSVGIAIQSSDTGALLAPFLTAVVAHKIPESFSLSTLLIKSNLKNKNVVWFILMYCLMTPAGILLARYSLDLTINSSLTSLIALSTGTFIYIATSDLLPQVHHKGRSRFIHLTLFVAGLFIIYILK